MWFKHIAIADLQWSWMLAEKLVWASMCRKIGCNFWKDWLHFARWLFDSYRIGNKKNAEIIIFLKLGISVAVWLKPAFTFCKSFILCHFIY